MPSDGENDRADEPFSRENSTGSPIISKHGYRSATDAQVFPGCCNRSLLLISRSSIFLYVSSCKVRLEEDNTSLNMETSSKLCFFFLETGFQVSTHGESPLSPMAHGWVVFPNFFGPMASPIQVVCVSTRKCCDHDSTKHLKASCVST